MRIFFASADKARTARIKQPTRYIWCGAEKAEWVANQMSLNHAFFVPKKNTWVGTEKERDTLAGIE